MGPLESASQSTSTVSESIGEPEASCSPNNTTTTTTTGINPFFVKYFRTNSVRTVIRCNEVLYDAGHFLRAGIQHHELFFEDGTCPSEAIMRRFCEIVESVPDGGAVAVHCKAGLGRTGVLIAAYLMKHYGYSANEAVGWLRICRPGCVIGLQHRFLVKCWPWLRHQGALWRKRKLSSSAAAATSGSSFFGRDKLPFGIYSINANLDCHRRKTDFVQVNKQEINAVLQDQFY